MKGKASFFGSSGGKRIQSAMGPNTKAGGRPFSGNGAGSFINFDFVKKVTSASKRLDTANIKPLKRVNTANFHTIIYKIKESKESLEKKIVDLETWQKEFKENNVWNTP